MIGKGLEKKNARGLLMVAASLAVLAGAAKAVGPAGDGPAAARSEDRNAALAEPACAKPIQDLLARIWASGFFRRNEAVRRELRNNTYAFFNRTGPRPPKGTKGLGCFAPGHDGPDTIFLKKELFSRFEIAMDGVLIFPDASCRALTVLVHEITHDLWANVLDESERAAFCREGVDFMEEYRRAQTPEDRRRFLEQAGDDLGDPATLRSYFGIDEILDTIPPGKLRGHELFAWLAERLFTTKAPIPRLLGKYYASILADETLGPREP
jgi:hypothetical protein